MTKKRKRYHKDDKLNDAIWNSMHKDGCISVTYLQMKTHMSFEYIDEATKDLPRWTKTRLKHWIEKERIKLILSQYDEKVA